ncbi:MAG: hypothetical protein AD742_00375 [Methylibium sp. NZG]|nr:MAG: hypothetical protein AD742_00375 [Methylibium sp. NZG]
MNKTTGVQGITEDDIANYLANTPGFFERHAELLGAVQLGNPHGGRAVSLQERQMDMLRDKLKGMEMAIIEMIRHGQENMAIADKLHRWTRTLMLTTSAADVPDVLVRELIHQYMVPQAAVRLWGADPAFDGLSFTQGVGADVKSFASSLTAPYCGVNSGFEAVKWVDEPARVMSMALIPLRHGAAPEAFGMLMLASPDATRYTADMGTEFLTRIGEVASAALARLLPVR